MRATISFETDVDQVEGTMAVVACSEEHNLRAAADILSNYTVLDGSLLDAITEVLRLLDMSMTQLQQYRSMLISFEKAKYETILPTSDPAPVAVQSSPAQRLGFDKFMDKLATEEDEDAPDTEEG
tara:strand:- start:572 stop:946 length:375 start_codon:yes stop_codon:yes gene_type:complete